MTNEELNQIVERVLSVIRTNSKTIEQLTPVGEIADSDMFEISRGRSISYADLAEQILSIRNDDIVSALGQEIRDRTDADTALSEADAELESAASALSARLAAIEGTPAVIWFDGIVDGAVIKTSPLNKISSDAGVRIVWNNAGGSFIAQYGSNGFIANSYSTWLDADKFNPARTDVIYADRQEHKLYVYDSSESLVEVYDELAVRVNEIETQVVTESEARAGADTELGGRIDELTENQPVTSEHTDEADLILADEDGNNIVSFADGHIKTANFDSAAISDDIDAALEALDSPIEKGESLDADYAISDENGFDIMRVADGHIKTKNFDSSQVESMIDSVDSPVTKSESLEADYAVSDENGFDAFRIVGGHIKTKNFDSAALGGDGIIALNRDAVEAAVMPMICSCDVKLLCFGDIHGDAANFARLKEWRAKYADDIDDTLCLGDINNVNATEPLSWYNDPSILNVIGNHDYYGASGRFLNAAECYSRYMGGIASWDVEYQANKCYYYKDYGNVRLIVLDCIKAHWNADTSQASWLTSALDSARASGKAVLIATHYPVDDWTEIDCPFSENDVSSVYDKRTDVSTAVKSFKDAGGTFIAYLCGHTHNDIVGVLQSHSSQLMITFDSATIRPDENKDLRQRGTKSQDCFTMVGVDTARSLLMLYRIGNSTDRYLRSKRVLTINYNTKEIITNY